MLSNRPKNHFTIVYFNKLPDIFFVNKSTTLYQAESKYTRYGQMLVFYTFHYFTTNSDIILAYIYFLIKIPACVFFGDLTRFVYLHAAPIHFTLSIACNKEVERRSKTLLIFTYGESYTDVAEIGYTFLCDHRMFWLR